MKINFGVSIFCLLSVLQVIGRDTTNSIHIQRLRCEYLNNPMGIDVVNPRLSWMMTSGEKEKSQTAYQIIVSTSAENLNLDKGDLWNSGKVTSSSQKHIRYSGKPLSSRMQCFWKIRVWDEKNRASSWSEPASWTIGLLKKSDWKASWIGDTAVNLPHWKEKYVQPHCGYHSAFVMAADQPQTVTVDLGAAKQFNQVQLYPASPGNSTIFGYLFPVRFFIETSNNPNFNTAKILVDQRSGDLPNPGKNPVSFNLPSTRSRYIRITVVKQSESVYAKGKYGFALGELIIVDNRRNISKDAHVIADSPIKNINDGWGPELLTDGVTERIDLPPVVAPPLKPAPLLRKSFHTSQKQIDRALIYVSTLGLSEITINGIKVGDQVLAPEWTDYHKRVQYQTYDVTHLVSNGENIVGATIADGWYIGPIFTYAGRGAYGFNRRLMAQLEIRYSDGQLQTIATDKSWMMYSDGPLREASLFDGENVDDTKSPGRWQERGYDASRWTNALVDTSVHIQLSAQMNEPVKVVRELDVVNISKVNEDTYIYDLGQNMVGWCLVDIPGYEAQQLTFRYAEVLNDSGTIYRGNLRGAQQVDRYKGPAVAQLVYEPKFTYHGFRYVEIKGLKGPLPPGAVKGRVVASSAETTGAFECSSEDLNHLWKNIWWTQVGNMHSVPTDCPQRDERAGWMGDAQVFSETALFNMNMGAFFTKWVRDIRDSQTPDGEFGDFSPMLGYNKAFYNAPGWADAGVIVPWRLYEYYGDKEVLKNQFAAMCRFIDKIHKQNPDHIWKNGTGNGYGDWLNGNTIVSADYPKTGGQVPFRQYSTAFYAYSTGLVARIAHVLGRQKEKDYYNALHQRIRLAFLKTFLRDDGTLEGNTQAGYALALNFGLLPSSVVKKASENMVNAVKAYDYRVSTGIQSTIRLMNELTASGHNDIAYRLIESDRFPSWLYSIRQGATTVWERWDGYVKGRGFQDEGMNSFNHYAIGAVGEWMYKVILGIRPDTSAPGFNRFVIQPEPGGSVTWAKGSYSSINGDIKVNWNKSASRFILKVDVPVNTVAIIKFPKEYQGSLTESGRSVNKEYQTAGAEKENGYSVITRSGSYEFSIEK